VIDLEHPGHARQGRVTEMLRAERQREVPPILPRVRHGADGKIELVANRVYLLTPADVEVSAEERERLAGGGFYNQF